MRTFGELVGRTSISILCISRLLSGLPGRDVPSSDSRTQNRFCWPATCHHGKAESHAALNDETIT